MLVATIVVRSSFTVLAHWRKWQLPAYRLDIDRQQQLRTAPRLRSLDEREVKKITEDNSEQ